jgi:hypothetical protein
MPVVRLEKHVGEDFRPQIRQAKEALRDLETDRYERGLFKGEDGAQRYAAQYAKLEERLSGLRTMNAGAFVEVAPAQRGGKKLDTSRIAVYFADEGFIRRAEAEGKDLESAVVPVID